MTHSNKSSSIQFKIGVNGVITGGEREGEGEGEGEGIGGNGGGSTIDGVIGLLVGGVEVEADVDK